MSLGILIGTGPLRVEVLRYGARLHDVQLDGVAQGLVANLPDLDAYRADSTYRGAVVGPVAGRLSGAAAMIGEQLWRFPPNEGTQLLHGGAEGFHARDWDLVDQGPDHVTLRLDLGHCEGGFPGVRRVEAQYRVDGQSLRLDLVALSDRPTLMALAPHVYWNLTGRADLRGHRLRVAADRVLPVDARLCPVGPPVPVAGPMDLRAGRMLGDGPRYDDCFCLSDRRSALRPVAWLDAPGAPALELATTEPGLQVYDGGAAFFGVALESQCWPDAPNQPGSPSILLAPDGGAQAQCTVWTFTLPGEN